MIIFWILYIFTSSNQSVVQEIVKNSYEEFMSLYLDYWQFLNIPAKYQIRKKLKDFMVHTMVLNMQGMDIGSSEYVQEMKSRMNMTQNTDVYNYRSRLKSKGYLLEDDGNITLPQALNIPQVPRKAVFTFAVITNIKAPLPVQPKTIRQEIPKQEPPRQKVVKEAPEEDVIVEMPPPPKPVSNGKSSEMYTAARNAYLAANSIKRRTGYSDDQFISKMVEYDARHAEPDEEEEDTYNIIDLES